MKSDKELIEEVFDHSISFYEDNTYRYSLALKQTSAYDPEQLKRFHKEYSEPTAILKRLKTLKADMLRRLD